MAHDDPNSAEPNGGDPSTSDPSTAFQALVAELSEKLDEARSHLDQSGSAFRELVEQTQSDLEATVRREITAALPEAEATPASAATGLTAGDLRAAIEQIDGAESQAEVLSRMLEQIGGASGRAALLLGQSMDPIESQDSLSVWNAVGFGRESFDGIEVEVPELWRPALVADSSLELSDEEAAPILDALGGDHADSAVLIPFVLRDAAYAVLYADDHGHDLDADAVQILCFVASQAMECLAVRSARPAASILPLVESSGADAGDSQSRDADSRDTDAGETDAEDAGPADPDASGAATEDTGSGDSSSGAPDEPESRPDERTADETQVDTDGPSTPAFFASPSMQGVGTAAPQPPAAIEDDSPTQTDGIPWPQEAADIEEPAPELIEAEPVALETTDPEPEPEEAETEETGSTDSDPINRVTAETTAPTWIEAESETPSQGFVVGNQTPAGDTVEVIEPEPELAPIPVADSFVSAIDEPAHAPPLTPPPPPPPIQPPTAGADVATRTIPPVQTEAQPSETDAPEEVDDPDADGSATDETPSGAAPLQAPAEPPVESRDRTAPPRPAAFDTLSPAPPTPAPETPSHAAGGGVPTGNETVTLPHAAAPVTPPPVTRTPDISAEEPPEIEVPKTPPVTSPGGSEVRPPDNVDGPGRAFMRETNSGEDPRDDEARRLARLLVSELKLYNEDEIGRGKRAGNIYQHLREDIDRSRRIYEERIADEVRQRSDFLHEELVRGLADGNPDLLGM